MVVKCLWKNHGITLKRCFDSIILTALYHEPVNTPGKDVAVTLKKHHLVNLHYDVSATFPGNVLAVWNFLHIKPRVYNVRGHTS